jgi:hypothetical protein
MIFQITEYKIGNGEYGGVNNDKYVYKKYLNETKIYNNIHFLHKNKCYNIFSLNPKKIIYNQIYLSSPMEHFFDQYRNIFCLGENYSIEIYLKNQLFHLELTKSYLNFYLTSKIHSNQIIKKVSNFKIVSYNIFNFNDHFHLRKYLLSLLIKQINPDVIGFQEIRLDENQLFNTLNDPHQIESFQSLLNFKNFYFKPAMSYININDFSKIRFFIFNSHRYEEGLAILSNLKMSNYGYIQLTRDLYNPNSHQRICLHSIINNEFHFLTTHLELV